MEAAESSLSGSPAKAPRRTRSQATVHIPLGKTVLPAICVVCGKAGRKYKPGRRGYEQLIRMETINGGKQARVAVNIVIYFPLNLDLNTIRIRSCSCHLKFELLIMIIKKLYYFVVVGRLREAAAGQRDDRILLLLGQDCVAAEVQYHQTCKNSYVAAYNSMRKK